MRKQGVSTTSFLIAVAIIAAAASILYFINRSVLLSTDESDDMRKMRMIMGAIDLYESQNNGDPPPRLSMTDRDVGNRSIFISANDPFTIGTVFPVDPAFPDGKGRSPFRISFTYLPQWIANGHVKPEDWHAVFEEPRVGLLACYWYGNTSHLRRDGLDSKGPIIRVNMDGSAVTVPVRKGQSLLSARELFNLP